MARKQDAIALLRVDHREVSEMFERYESLRAARHKKALVADICEALVVHAQVEEEIFYPAVQKALKDKALVPEARVEHATMKGLIATLEDREPDGEMYDAQVKVLGEYVKHHVKEEQGEMFRRVKELGGRKLDLEALGEQMLARKQELLGLAPTAEDAGHVTELQSDDADAT